MEVKKLCSTCKNTYWDMDNNIRCPFLKYPKSNIVKRNWGQWDNENAKNCEQYR